MEITEWGGNGMKYYEKNLLRKKGCKKTSDNDERWEIFYGEDCMKNKEEGEWSIPPKVGGINL